MAIVRTGTGKYEHELAKHEQLPRDVIAVDQLGNSVPPGNPYVFRRWPAMLYKAFKKDGGAVMCCDNPMAYREEADQLAAEQFSRRCQLLVHNESQYDRAKADGWRDTPQEAIDEFELQQQRIGDATAERHFRDERMSTKAQEEALRHDRATAAHQPDGPPVPKKRGRRKKVVTDAAVAAEGESVDVKTE